MNTSQDSRSGEKEDSRNSIGRTKEVPEGRVFSLKAVTLIMQEDTAPGATVREEVGYTRQDQKTKPSECGAEDLTLECTDLRRLAFQKADAFRKRNEKTQRPHRKGFMVCRASKPHGKRVEMGRK